jgi:hypothetical protein
MDDMADTANQLLEYYKSTYNTATDDIPFDIEKDPYGKAYLRETGMDNRIALITYPADGLAGVDITKNYLAFARQSSTFNDYDYEAGLSSLSDVPKSVSMDAENALKIAEDSVNAIAAGEDMELVRVATINKASTYTTDINDYQDLNPECLVFYFMRSYGGAKSTYFPPSDVQFNLNEANPQYRPGVLPEYIRVIVDDLNIVEWAWANPCMITDEISGDVPLMPFEKIKDISVRLNKKKS